MCPLDLGYVCGPSCSSKARVVEDARVNVNQTFPNPIFDVSEIGSSELPDEKAMGRIRSASLHDQSCAIVRECFNVDVVALDLLFIL